MAAAQVARRSGRAVAAAVLRRLGRGCFEKALRLLAEQRSLHTAADLAADRAKMAVDVETRELRRPGARSQVIYL